MAVKDQHPLAKAREAAGWSQEDLVDASGVKLNVIKSIETFRTRTTAAANVDKLTRALGNAGVDTDAVREALTGRSREQTDKLQAELDALAGEVADLTATIQTLHNAIEEIHRRLDRGR